MMHFKNYLAIRQELFRLFKIVEDMKWFGLPERYENTDLGIGPMEDEMLALLRQAVGLADNRVKRLNKMLGELDNKD